MQNFVLVFVGGGLGAIARYWLSGLLSQRAGSAFPYGTLAVNVLGCFLIGVLMSALEDRFVVYPSLRVFLTIGILGGFTTFSSFSFETVAMLKDGQFFYASLNVCLSVFACVGGTLIGMKFGRLF